MATAYVTFIVADYFCHVSGVVATMTVGLYLGNRARLELSRDALYSMHAVWEFLALCANTLVFLEAARATPCLRVHISQIRRKLEPNRTQPRDLLTEPGLGYRLRAGDTETIAQLA